MSYHLHAALAHERQRTLLAEAEAFRLAEQARNHRLTNRDTVRAARRWRPRCQPVQLAVSAAETPA